MSQLLSDPKIKLCGIVLIIALLLVIEIGLRRWERGKAERERFTANAEFIASPAFLKTAEWKRARYDALKRSDGRCELCGRNKHQLPPGEYLNVDHIKPRKTHPHLALESKNFQILCHPCNEGKGNRDSTDWRKP